MNISKYKNTSVGLIPIDWEVKSLGKISQVYDGTHMTPDYKESGVPFFSVEHLTSNNFNKTKFISREVYEKEIKRTKIEKGDILMTRIGDIGTIKFIDWDFDASFYVSLALLKNKSDNDFKFLSYQLQSNSFKKELDKRIIHVAFPIKINLGEIGLCLIVLPPIIEQHKIATILSNWDTAIEKCEKIVENLKIRNFGLAQQLLSGKMRAKGFEEKWKTMKLSDFSINKNSSLSINNLEGNIGTFPLYGANRIIQRIDFFESEDPYISIIKDGAGVGRVFLCEGKSSVLGTMAYIKSNEKSTLNFLFHLLKSIRFESFITGSTIPHIYFSSYGKKQFEIPNVAEQKIIANILDKATDELNHYQQKLEALQLQKKGLMQQLLTGKTRVKI